MRFHSVTKAAKREHREKWLYMRLREHVGQRRGDTQTRPAYRSSILSHFEGGGGIFCSGKGGMLEKWWRV